MSPTESHASEQRIVGEGGAEPSVASGLERLLTASQGVVTKRIDLALLEIQEIMSRGVVSAALVGLSVLWLAAAWFATVLCIVLLIAADASLIERVGLFAVANAAAAGLAAFVLRRQPPLILRPGP